jgi:adenylate cyclase
LAFASTVGTEIERKFLVTEGALSELEATHQVALRQGYLSSEPGRTVRVRLQNDQGYLTVKGRARGFARPEFEYPIPEQDAEALLELCSRPLIEKWRHYVEYAGKVWEVDEFFGDNAGLVVAELELDSEDEIFERPPWLGEEVTMDPRYHNSRLAEHPYKEWKGQLAATAQERGTPEGVAIEPAKAGSSSPDGEAFVLLAELYVPPGQEAAFLRYEAQVLALLETHGLKLHHRIRHGETARGAEAPFETHILHVPGEAAFQNYQSDPERLALEAEREQVLVRLEVRRGAAV